MKLTLPVITIIFLALLCGCSSFTPPLPHIGTTIFDGNGAAP